MSNIEVFVTGPSREIVAQIDDFQALNVVKNFNDVGAWKLDIRSDLPFASWFIPKSGIVVMRDGKELISGPMTFINRSKGEQSPMEDHLSIEGADYNLHLSQRLALPCQPFREKPFYGGDPDFKDAVYDDAPNAAAESVIKYFVEKNLTPGGWDGVKTVGTVDISRAIPLLTVAPDKGLGYTIDSTKARFVNLLVLLKAIAVAGGDIGFGIERSAADLVFDCFKPTDRSDSVRFAEEFGNLVSFQYGQAMPTATYALVGLEGEGTSRTFYENWALNFFYQNSGIETWGRIEGDLIDAGNSQEPYFVALDNALKEGQRKTSISFKLVETDRIRYGKDFAIGDIVGINVDGAEFTNVVRSVEFDYQQHQPESVSLTVGQPDAKNPLIPTFFNKQKRNSTRLTSLEAR